MVYRRNLEAGYRSSKTRHTAFNHCQSVRTRHRYSVFDALIAIWLHLLLFFLRYTVPPALSSRTLRLCVWSSTWGPGHLASQSLDQTTYLRSSLMIVDSLVIRKISSCFFYLFESRRRLQMNYLKQWYGWLLSRSYFKYKIYIYAILTSNIFSYNIFKFWNFSFFLLWYIKSID